MITLVVADDHAIVRQGIVGLLAAEPDIEVVAEAAEGQEAVDATLRHRPSAVLMDLRMPGMGGVEAIVAIKARWPEAAVLVLTTYDTDEAIVRAVEAGASGYLLKDAPSEVLIDAVRRSAAGETVFAPPVTNVLAQRMRRPAGRSLTAREIDVIREVAAGNTNAAIAERLHISEATVKTHLLHIFDKLDVADRAAAVSQAYKRGVLSL